MKTSMLQYVKLPRARGGIFLKFKVIMARSIMSCDQKGMILGRSLMTCYVTGSIMLLNESILW